MNGGEDSSEPQDQWWRLAYVPNDPDAVKVEVGICRIACPETSSANVRLSRKRPLMWPSRLLVRRLTSRY